VHPVRDRRPPLLKPESRFGPQVQPPSRYLHVNKQKARASARAFFGARLPRPCVTDSRYRADRPM
jgi:hypothetical protein